ncbi:hypothetical protein HMPREF1545_03192 [Oscillibacter sp. KLE 1728]|nr:hypothetical protein HMPREF1545_03192 [Oscillibacter sp. KLE 1728]ERK66369.1 hypothetical protein HMPREF1546_00913 [Oscillibacter sp. KLE 1745]
MNISMADSTNSRIPICGFQNIFFFKNRIFFEKGIVKEQFLL